MPNERRHKPEIDEAILIGLDQLSQTLEVMNQVVCRLKSQLSANAAETAQPSNHDRRSTDNKEISQVH